MHTLVGYSDHPTGLQAVIYAGVLTAILVLTRVVKPNVLERRVPGVI